MLRKEYTQVTWADSRNDANCYLALSDKEIAKDHIWEGTLQ